MNTSSIMSVNSLEEFPNVIEDSMNCSTRSVFVPQDHLGIDGVHKRLQAIRRRVEKTYH